MEWENISLLDAEKNVRRQQHGIWQGGDTGIYHQHQPTMIRNYPLVNIQKAIENGHRNSWFSHETWWIFPVRFLYVYQAEGKWYCGWASESLQQLIHVWRLKKGFQPSFWWLAGLRWPIHSTMMLDQINHWECVQDGAPPVMWMLVYKPHELARYIYHKP